MMKYSEKGSLWMDFCFQKLLSVCIWESYNEDFKKAEKQTRKDYLII